MTLEANVLTELRELREAVTQLQQDRVIHQEIEVTATDPAEGTITGVVPSSGDEVSGIDWPTQFLPDVGTNVRVRTAGGVPIADPTSIAENAVTTRELDPDVITMIESAGVSYYTSPTEPAHTGPADSGIWIDSDNGFRISRWDGDSWEELPFGPQAFQAGAVTATVLAADAINGKTITGATFQTSAPGGGIARLVFDAINGLRGIDSGGITKIQVDTDGTLTAVDADISGALTAGQLTATPDAYGEANASGDVRPVRGGMWWNSGVAGALTDWQDPVLVIVPWGEGPPYDGGEIILIAGQDTVTDTAPAELVLHRQRATLGSFYPDIAVPDGYDAAVHTDGGSGVASLEARVRAELNAPAVEVNGHGIPYGILERASTATAFTTTGTAEQVMSGTGFLELIATLETGRAYAVVWEGVLGTAGAAGSVGVNVRGKINATPTTSSPIATGCYDNASAAGGNGQFSATTGIRAFQVSAGGSWRFRPTCRVRAGTATQAYLTTDDRAVHTLVLLDLGVAPSGLRSITSA